MAVTPAKKTGLASSVFEVALMLLITLALLEGVLRVFPGIIPLEILNGFNPVLRTEIAKERGLQTASDLVYEKDSLGFPVPLYKPGVSISLPVPANDAGEGAIETVRMDERGFCNPEGTYEPASIPIIATGDSFTWCKSVDAKDTWPLQLGASLGIATYNMGKQNQGLYEEVYEVEKIAVPKNPRIVILAVYEGNDITDAEQYALFLKQATSSVDSVQQYKNSFCALPQFLCPFYKTVKEGVLGEHSYAFNTLNGFIRIVYVSVFDAITGNNFFLSHAPFVYSDFSYTISGPEGGVLMNGGAHDRDEPESALRVKQGSLSFGLFNDALKKYSELARQHGFIPVLAYIPGAYSAYAPYITYTNPELKPLMEEFSSNQRSYFADKSKELGLHFVDLTPGLLKASSEYRTSGHLLYFPNNVHLTVRGHAVVSDLLKQFLVPFLQN